MSAELQPPVEQVDAQDAQRASPRQYVYAKSMITLRKLDDHLFRFWHILRETYPPAPGTEGA